MPNHVTTSVEIVGPKDKISKLIKDTKIKLERDVENEFDFNGIIPMPPELQITSGTSTDLGMAALDDGMFTRHSKFSWFEDRFPGVKTKEQLEEFLKNGDKSDQEALEEGRQALENLKTHGFKDWYDWSVERWGTKWNSYNVSYINHDDNHLVLQIDTAWDTPRGIWEELESRGLKVNGVVHGEVDDTEIMGDGGPFWVSTAVEYANYLTPLEEEE